MTHPPSPPLLRLLRALPGTPAAVVDPLDGPTARTLVESARRHALSAWVRHLLAEAHLSLPPEHARTLQADAASVVGTNLRLKALLLRALDALHDEGIPPPVLLKGYGLGLRLYPDPLLRASTDVDLLVEERHLSAAGRALSSLGLRQVSDPGWGDPLEHHHHLGFTGEAGTVELHFLPSRGFGRSLRPEPLLARALPFTVEGRPARHPSPVDELVYLCVHAAQHAFLRLAWLFDLKLLALRNGDLLQRHAEDVAHAARASGMAVAIRSALELARNAVGLELSPSLWELLPGEGVRTAVARRLFTEDALVSARWAEGKVPSFLARTLLCTGAAATSRHLLEGAARVARRRSSRR